MEESCAAGTIQGACGPASTQPQPNRRERGTGLHDANGTEEMKTGATQVPDETERKVSSQELGTSSVSQMGREAGQVSAVNLSPWALLGLLVLGLSSFLTLIPCHFCLYLQPSGLPSAMGSCAWLSWALVHLPQHKMALNRMIAYQA